MEIEEILQKAKAKTKLENINRENRYKTFLQELSIPQEQFFLSTAKILGCIAANRSGKTTIGCEKSVYLALGEHPTIKVPIPNEGWICGVDFTAVDDYLIPTFFEYFPPSQIKHWDSKKMVLTTKQGSKVRFKSYAQGVEAFQSKKIHWCYLDEEPPYAIFNECKARLLDFDGVVYITVTPLKGLTYLYDEVWVPGYGQNIHDYEFAVSMSTYDNPFYKGRREIIDKWASRLSPEERTIRVFGLFRSLTGRILTNFDKNIHVIPQFDIPMSWPIVLFLDHGLNNPTAVTFWAIAPGDRYFIFDEYYENNASISTNTAIIKKMMGPYESRIIDFLGDPYDLTKRSAKDKTSLLSEYRKEGLKYLRCAQRVPLNVRIDKMLNLLKTGPEQPSSRLKILSNCEKHIWEAERWTWQRYYLSDNPAREITEEPIRKDDHLMKGCSFISYMEPKFKVMNQRTVIEPVTYKPFIRKLGW